MKYYLRILATLIFKTKIIFQIPKKVDIILYDQGEIFNKKIKEMFPNLIVEILYARLEKVNLYILVLSLSKSFFFKKKIFLNYLIKYCEFTNPKYIITSTDYDEKIYKIKKYSNLKSKFVIIQRCPLYPNYLSSISSKYNIDYILCFNEYSKRIYKKKFKSKYFIIGSFLNNFYPIVNSKNKKRGILLISGFKKNFIIKKEDKDRIRSNGSDVYFEKKIIEIIYSFSKRKKIKFKILLKPFVSINSAKNFFNIDSNLFFYNPGTVAYKLIDNYKLIVFCSNSNLYNESISRKSKCLIFSKKNLNFSEVEIIAKIEKSYFDLPKKLKDNNLKTFLEKTNNRLIFDNGNKILRSIISS